MGTMIDVDELCAMNSIVSTSSTKPLKDIRTIDRSSSFLFPQNSEVNEILKGLKYFSQEVTTSDGKKGPKNAYSWGKVRHF